MCAAQSDEIVRVVLPALGSGIDVVDVDVDGVPAAGHAAAPSVAPEHVPAHRRRNRLLGAMSAVTHVGIRGRVFGKRYRLHVALRHLDDLGPDPGELTAPDRLAAPAALANGERHLIARSPLVRRPAEDLSGHQEERRVVVERLARVAPELRERLAHEGQRLRGDFEAKDAPLRSRIDPVTRAATRAVPGHERFDLARRSTARHVEPFGFGLGRCDASELARRRPRHARSLERARELGQLLERLGDAELLPREARRVAEEPLGVLREARVPEPNVRRRAQRPKQPASLDRVEPRSIRRKPNEPGVRKLPFGQRLAVVPLTRILCSRATSIVHGILPG